MPPADKRKCRYRPFICCDPQKRPARRSSGRAAMCSTFVPERNWSRASRRPVLKLRRSSSQHWRHNLGSRQCPRGAVSDLIGAVRQHGEGQTSALSRL